MALSSSSSYDVSSSSMSSSSSSSPTSESSLSTSTSSTSSSSSSSSSSIDSSSSSSIDSSSSSSFEGWNRTKPLTLALAAVNSVTILNRLAQTIYITDDSYTVGTVYCYFYGPYGEETSYTIHLGVYLCNDSGEPSALLSSQTLSGTSITKNGWYSFDFDISGTTPDNGYLSFVVWQEGGSEDNYVLWGYGFSDTLMGSKAWFSNDATNWTLQEGVVRALKVVENFDPYDLTDFSILTPPAESKCSTQELTGTYDNTTLVTGDAPDQVEIDYPKLFTSIVVDSSGSMGWNDRFSTRQEFIEEYIDRLKEFYPSDVLFDIVTFGAQTADTSSIFADIGQAATINLDLNNPTRTSYVFDVSSAIASKGAIYAVNNSSFTITQTISGEDVLVSMANGDAEPFTAGTLVKQSGSGDSEIDYDSVDKIDIGDTIVAYGFKNLEEDHSYNIGEINIDGTLITEVSLNNWQPLIADGWVDISIGDNGPKDSSSLDLVASADLTLRHPFSQKILQTTPLTQSALKGDVSITVSSTSFIGVDDRIDVVDSDIASMGHTVTNVSSSVITVEPGLTYDIGGWSSKGGIVQESNFTSSVDVNGTTAQLLVRDVNVNQVVTFFMQARNGLYIEWDFTPHPEWYINKLYWIDETALLPVSVFDTDGNPFPDGTKIVFYVDQQPADSIKDDQRVAELGLEDAASGTSKIYLDSTDDFSVGIRVDLLDNQNNIQTVTITSIGSDVDGGFIIFSPALDFDFEVANGAKVVKTITALDATNAASKISRSTLLSASIATVDATPIYTGKNIDSSLLESYDPTPVSPSTTYAELNLDRDRIRNNANDVPTIDGEVLLRILPVTEDNLKTVSEKEAELARLIRPESPRVFPAQFEQTGGDSHTTDEDVVDALGSITTTTTTAILSRGEDYEIDNPVYLLSGYAESALVTFSTDLEEQTFSGINVPGISNAEGSTLLVKKYTLYPSIVMQSSEQIEVAKQYLTPFEVYFTPPISIYSQYSGEQVPFIVEKAADEDCPAVFQGYEEKTVNGVYATDDGFALEYTVTDEGALANNVQLTVKIYSNAILDMGEVVGQQDLEYSVQKFNSTLPKESVTAPNGDVIERQPLTNIDAWREEVESNPLNETLEGDTLSQLTSSVQTASVNSTNSIIDQLGGGIIGRVKRQLGIETAGEDTEPVFEYYANPLEWTKATQYGDLQEQTVDIVNGKATVYIPSSDVAALLMVEASMAFGDNDRFESIRVDLIPVANPIDVTAISPEQIKAEGGTQVYEIGTKVTWKGDDIADNVVVNFDPPSTKAIPSVGKTDSGWAGGVFLGPHEEVVMNCVEDSLCPCTGEFEDINITISYLGYERTVSRKIEWTGDDNSTLTDPNEFYFKVNTEGISGAAWADGEGSSSTTLTSDLNEDVEDLLWIGEDGIQRLQGNDQVPLPPQFPNGAPSVVRYQAQNIIVAPNQERWTEGKASAVVYGLNQNIGHMPPTSETSPFASDLPWSTRVNVTTSYRNFDEDKDKYITRIGTGVVQFPYFVPSAGGTSLIVPYPLAVFKEPLGISVAIESYDDEFIRDGVSSPNIVAEITWKGSPIKNTFTKNEGQLNEVTIDFPFPTVTFEAGILEEINAVVVDDVTYAIDNRNTTSGCLVVGEHPDVSLSSYAAKASLSRTDINTYIESIGESSITNRHTHSCEVDSSGNGITTGTTVLEGSYANHTHQITDYEALSGGSPSHTHDLRCVAVVKLLPLTNPNVNIVINSYVVYDPTAASSYDASSGEGTTPHSSEFPDGNRMMFATAYVDSVVQDRELVVTMTVQNNYTALEVTETDRAMNVLVEAKFSQYSVEVSDGQWVVIPEQPVPDGTRVVFKIDSFKVLPAEEASNILVIRPDTVREYMYVRVAATAYAEGLEGSDSEIIIVSSNLQWLPSVKSLLLEPTDDTIYLDAAIAQIDTLGASQIHDAVRKAAQQIIEFKSSNSSWSDATKIILLLTDGDENMSEYSLNQATDHVNFIDGDCEVPVIPIRLGFSYSSDDVLLGKYASETGGENQYLIDATSSEIQDRIDDIITNGSIKVNNGIYSDTIDLGSDNIASTISINNILLPTGTRITFRTRFGSDNVTWSTWSEWFDSSVDEEFDLSLVSKGRYFQYQIRLYGNENFESPSLQAGAEICYYSVQSFTVFFQPVDLDINDDEYVASIHITHQATIPNTSTITYGYSQFNTTEIEDYYGITQPLITPDRQTIILTRYNETFLTEDSKTYTAINGRWPSQASIEVYRVNSLTPKGELIDPSTYAANSNDGTITFYNVQAPTDTFVLCVYFDPVFRIICNVMNYGPETITIDHIGVLYNITKRIPRDSDGNIIHTPINERIT